MSEKNPSREFSDSFEMKDTIRRLINEIIGEDKVGVLHLRIKLKDELLSRKDENNESKYIQFEPVDPVDPRKCLVNYRAWHYFVGSSWHEKIPPYEDLPGEDSIVSILTQWAQEKK